MGKGGKKKKLTRKFLFFLSFTSLFLVLLGFRFVPVVSLLWVVEAVVVVVFSSGLLLAVLQ